MNKKPKQTRGENIVSIHQPAYLPWLGYFHKIASSDIFVVLDTVQFEKNSYINRNKVLTSSGPIWLTVPVETKGTFKNNPLTHSSISNSTAWQQKHWRSIEQNYRKTPFFKEYADQLVLFYQKPYTLLSRLCRDMLSFFLQRLGIGTKIIYASELDDITGEKTMLVFNICRRLKATTYLSGKLGKNYIDLNLFRTDNIEVVFQDYQHPVYDQTRDVFTSNLCILDLLFNMGPDSLDVLMHQP